MLIDDTFVLSFNSRQERKINICIQNFFFKALSIFDDIVNLLFKYKSIFTINQNTLLLVTETWDWGPLRVTVAQFAWPVVDPWLQPGLGHVQLYVYPLPVFHISSMTLHGNYDTFCSFGSSYPICTHFPPSLPLFQCSW